MGDPNSRSRRCPSEQHSRHAAELGGHAESVRQPSEAILSVLRCALGGVGLGRCRGLLEGRVAPALAERKSHFSRRPRSLVRSTSAAPWRPTQTRTLELPARQIGAVSGSMPRGLGCATRCVAHVALRREGRALSFSWKAGISLPKSGQTRAASPNLAECGSSLAEMGPTPVGLGRRRAPCAQRGQTRPTSARVVRDRPTLGRGQPIWGRPGIDHFFPEFGPLRPTCAWDRPN